MSSENEIVDQPGNDKPEIETDLQQPEPMIEAESVVESAVDQPPSVPLEPNQLETELVPDVSVAAESEPAVAGAEESEDGWNAWIDSTPEEEEVVESPVEIVDETDSVVEVEAESIIEEPAVSAEAEPQAEDEKPFAEVEEPVAPIEPEIENQETVEVSPIESEEPTPETTTKPAPKPRKQKKSRRDGLKVHDVITYFAPCGRCGYFLSGYRAAYGRENLETAVYEAKSGWITLSWGIAMPELILKSYGNRIETSDLHFDGCCSDCRRAFVYKNAGDGEQSFRIEIKPQTRQ